MKTKNRFQFDSNINGSNLFNTAINELAREPILDNKELGNLFLDIPQSNLIYTEEDNSEIKQDLSELDISSLREDLWYYLRLSNSTDKDFMYFYMYYLYRQIQLPELSKLLLDVLLIDDTKNVATGISQALWFFENFELEYEVIENIGRIISSLLLVDNDVINLKVEELLDYFLDDRLYRFFSESGFKEKSVFNVIENIWNNKV